MAEHEYEGTVSISAFADVWRSGRTSAAGTRWDPAVQVGGHQGHFGEGAGGTLTLTGGVHAPFYPRPSSLACASSTGSRSASWTVYIDHVVKATADGAEVTRRTSVSGPNAEELSVLVVAADTRRRRSRRWSPWRSRKS